MIILVNGAEQVVPDAATPAGLVELLELQGKRIAMEVNREIVPRSDYASITLQAGDQVEIVHAIGGG